MSQKKQADDIKSGYFPVTLTLFQDMCRLKLSASAQAVLLYIIRHTVGWQHDGARQRFVRLKVQDFIQGRPTSDGDDVLDAGTPLTTPTTVMAALEECGVKGFIYELDRGKKDGYYSYGLQAKYWDDYGTVDEKEDKTPTTRYRFMRSPKGDGFIQKPDQQQQLHYYGTKRKKAK